VSAISPVLSETFEDVYSAVKETERGRWFLDEYAARLRTDETRTVLAAIQKLESVVTSLPATETRTPELDKVKAAIKLARESISTQLAPLAATQPNLSEEGQMFAALAKLSRQAIAEDATESLKTNVANGLDVALKLVQDIDNEFSFAPPPSMPASPPSAPEQKGEVSIVIKQKPNAETQKFFQQDADVFAPPAAAGFKGPSPAKSGDDTTNKGARLTINKSDSRGTETSAPFEQETSSAQSSIQDSSNSDAEPKPRIVIIRRKPEDLTQLPLVDEEKPGHAA
jgi:hypothetical protein